MTERGLNSWGCRDERALIFRVQPAAAQTAGRAFLNMALGRPIRLRLRPGAVARLRPAGCASGRPEADVQRSMARTARLRRIHPPRAGLYLLRQERI